MPFVIRLYIICLMPLERVAFLFLYVCHDKKKGATFVTPTYNIKHEETSYAVFLSVSSESEIALIRVLQSILFHISSSGSSVTDVNLSHSLSFKN